MKEIQPEELIEKLNSGEITSDQIYNLDLDMEQYCAIRHYIDYPDDNINKQQIIRALPFDIEVYHANKEIEISEDLRTGKSPISAITIYDEANKKYHIYFLVLPHISHLLTKEMIPNIIVKTRQMLLDNGYISDDESIEIYLYHNTELKMIEDCWKNIHVIDPAILTSFNGDNYDLPMIYKRLEILTGDEKKVQEILSKFKIVKKRKIEGGKFFYLIPEYPLLDVRRLYIPRSEGGLNYGKTQPNYTLDWISDQELKLKKLDFKQEGLSLDKLYDTDPITYLVYNLIDVILVQRLKEKLGHIDLHNLLRRDMKTPMGTSLRGQSGFFDTFLSYELERNGLMMKYGMGNEAIMNISEVEINKIPRPKESKVKWTVTHVTNTQYNGILNRFPGALKN